MSLILIVRRHEDSSFAISEASKLLALQRQQDWYFGEPEETEAVLGVWVHDALDETMARWAPGAAFACGEWPASSLEPASTPARRGPSILVRSAIQRSGRWALCWIDDLALLGAFGARDRLSAIDALLEALSGTALLPRDASFIPVFAGELSAAEIDEQMHELRARHPAALSARYLLESRVLGRDAGARSAA
jgi:hypothetical protein